LPASSQFRTMPDGTPRSSGPRIRRLAWPHLRAQRFRQAAAVPSTEARSSRKAAGSALLWAGGRVSGAEDQRASWPCRLQMLGEEGPERGVHPVRAEPLAPVARPGDLVESGLDPRALQRLVEQFALVAGHERVLLAVRDQQRRRSLRRVAEGVAKPLACSSGRVYNGAAVRQLPLPVASLQDCTQPGQPALHGIACNTVQRCNDATTGPSMSPDTPALSPQPASAAPAETSPAPSRTAADLLGRVVAARDLDKQRFTPPAWLWHGYLGPGKVTLLTNLWKSGKTTLVSLLLARMQQGGALHRTVSARSIHPGSPRDRSLPVAAPGRGGRRQDGLGSITALEAARCVSMRLPSGH
jgi:hypothetical protein